MNAIRQASQMRFHHLGIVAREMEAGCHVLHEAFPIVHWSNTWVDPIQRVRVRFGTDCSGIVYEVVVPETDDAPVARCLAQGQNLLNHVAYAVEDLAAEGARLRAQGWIPVRRPQPAEAFGGRPIQFWISSLGFLVELIERPTQNGDVQSAIGASPSTK